MKKKKTVSFTSLGCFKNLVDTEVLGGMLEKLGVSIVSSYEKTDWLIINTCGFIRDAKEESIDEILAALEKKKTGEISRVAVFGCLPQRYIKDFKESLADVDVLWGVNDFQQLAEIIYNDVPNPAYRSRELFLYSHENRRIHTSTPNSAFIKISEGCDMTCTFCAIPAIRGPYRSRSIDSILKEAESYRKRGCIEINLVSQNSTHFGMDTHKRKMLPQLIEELAKIGFPWIRIFYLMPEQVTDEIISAYTHRGVIPYFDLPFQHISPSVLKSMGRSGGFEKNMALLEKIRGLFPEAVIRSSFIAGFPGENEKDFQQLLQFASESKIEYIGVFAYSDEEGTQAFEIKGKNDPRKILDRKETLESVAEENLAALHKRLTGTEREFLPLGPWTHWTTIGRIPCQSPEIDGFIEAKGKFNSDYSLSTVKILDSREHILQGILQKGKIRKNKTT